ncbi:hypothetical protein PM082_024552 [Marasmius tenuissimus]|nr:hypothetical protein PM082_024552 [Marasmius tenuissimus]
MEIGPGSCRYSTSWAISARTRLDGQSGSRLAFRSESSSVPSESCSTVTFSNTYCYDTQDIQTPETLNIHNGFVVQDREVALDFIGICGTTVGISRERCIRYTQEILLKETLPHVAIAEDSESKKA